MWAASVCGRVSEWLMFVFLFQSFLRTFTVRHSPATIIMHFVLFWMCQYGSERKWWNYNKIERERYESKRLCYNTFGLVFAHEASFVNRSHSRSPFPSLLHYSREIQLMFSGVFFFNYRKSAIGWEKRFPGLFHMKFIGKCLWKFKSNFRSPFFDCKYACSQVVKYHFSVKKHR